METDAFPLPVTLERFRKLARSVRALARQKTREGVEEFRSETSARSVVVACEPAAAGTIFASGRARDVTMSATIRAKAHVHWPSLPAFECRWWRDALKWIHQTICGIRGHRVVLHFERGRLCLECFACGHQTRGWHLADVRVPCPRPVPFRRRPHVSVRAVPTR